VRGFLHCEKRCTGWRSDIQTSPPRHTVDEDDHDNGARSMMITVLIFALMRFGSLLVCSKGVESFITDSRLFMRSS
jgi:hypothetical protein